MEFMTGRQQSIDEIPKLRLVEEFLLKLSTISNFISENIGEVLEQDLDYEICVH